MTQGFHHRQPDVAHGFIARLRFAAVDHAVRAFADHLIKLVEGQALMRWVTWAAR
jgi:hypothetical protein